MAKHNGQPGERRKAMSKSDQTFAGEEHILACEGYYARLKAAGVPEREATRAFLFTSCKGFDAMQQNSDGCIIFAAPACGNWCCLDPDHQRFEA